MHYRNRSKSGPKGPKPVNAEGAKRGDRIDKMARAAKSKNATKAKQAKAELFKAIQPMMINIARIHSLRNGMPFDDVFQDTSLGFLRAVELWSPKGGANFLTYVGNWLHALGNRSGMKHRGARGNVRDPNRTHASLDAPVSSISDGATDDQSLHDFIGVDADQDTSVEAIERAEFVTRAVARLPKKEREVIRERMNDRTFDSIGGDRKCSRERIRQIQERALLRLGQRLAKQLDETPFVREPVKRQMKTPRERSLLEIVEKRICRRAKKNAESKAYYRAKKKRLEAEALAAAVQRVEELATIRPRSVPPHAPGVFGGRALVKVA